MKTETRIKDKKYPTCNLFFIPGVFALCLACVACLLCLNSALRSNICGDTVYMPDKYKWKMED